MASKPGFSYINSGETIYSTIRNEQGQIWDRLLNIFEDVNINKLVSAYSIPTPEQLTTKYYVVNLPTSLPDGQVFVDSFVQSGAEPVWADLNAAKGIFFIKGGFLFENMEMYQDNGANGLQYTKKALELGPDSSAGTGKLTEQDVQQIRFRLGLDGDNLVPTVNPDLSQFKHENADHLANFVNRATGETKVVAGSVAELARARVSLDLTPGYGTDFLKTPLCIIRGDTFVMSFNTTIDATGGLTEIWFTIKGNLLDPDDQAYIQITQTGDLIYPSDWTTTWGKVELTQENPAIIQVTIEPEATLQFPMKKDDLWFDLQVKQSTVIKTPVIGNCKFVGDVSRNVT